MRLYDNDAYREKFMQVAYDLLSGDGTNDRANQIIMFRRENPRSLTVG